jgi:hypothetical protein
MSKNTWVQSFDIEFKNNDENIYDLLIESTKIVNVKHCGFILDFNKKKNTILEKFIFDIAKYHFNRLGIIFDEDKYYIEIDIKNHINDIVMHLDNDIFKYTNYHDNQHADTEYKYLLSNGPNPFLTCIIYLNDDNIIPTIITNIDKKKFLDKDFDNANLYLSYPKKLKNIVFGGGKYFHTAHKLDRNISSRNISLDNQDRNIIIISFWKSEDLIKEKLKYLDNSIFPEKLLYNIKDNIKLQTTNSLLKIKENVEKKIIYYNKKTLSSIDIESFFDNKDYKKKIENKNFKKINTLISNNELINCDNIILKPLELYKNEYKFIVLSVATDPNHKGLQYFVKSLGKHDISYKILGLNDSWNGGNLEKYPGGGQKINLLKKELLTWDTETLKNTLLLFSDSYDVIIVSSETEIIQKYHRISKTSILFAGEKYCWPDENLKKYYPKTNSDYKYLNSGGFMGNAYDILQLLHMEIKDNDDDQLYFTKIFLFDNKDINESPKIKLDYNCEIFQTLNGTSRQDIYFYKNRILNKKFATIPCFIHGNGSGKELLYNIAKFIL